MELYFFGRFHTRAGNESAFEEALREVGLLSREEEGCLSFHGFRSLRERQLFYIHSVWRNEEAFEIHANLPHTLRFLERVQMLIDHPLDTTRTEMIA